MSFKKLFVLLVVLGLALSISLMAQNVVTGDIVGTVTDSSGAVVPKATVTAKNNGNGASITSITSSTGLYHFPLLQPGTYTITAAASGMQNTTRQAEVLVGQVNTVNIQLGVQGGKEVVEITAGAPLLQTENANIASTYNTQQINTLPNPGGDITNIAQTAPGVLMNVGSGFGYGNFQAFGLPGTANLFTVNGNDQNDPFLNLNNSGSSNLLLGTNELQQAVIVSNGYTGQYGRQAGVQEDVVTKSGTNGFHGDLDYKWNGSSLNANDWFNNHFNTPKPFANSNEYAADLGGPIFKDKTFFYVDTEGLRYILPSTFQLRLPTPAFESTVLSTIPANAIPLYTQIFSLYNGTQGFASAGPIAGTSFDDGAGGCGAFAGLGNTLGAANPCLSFLQANGKNLNREWLTTARIDQNLGANDKLFGRYKYDTGSQPTGTSIINNAFSTDSIQPEWDIQLNETHIFSPNAVNQFIASGLHYSAVFQSVDGNAAYNVFGPFISEAPVGGLMSSLGVNPAFPQGRKSTQYQGIDDFSLQRGNHAFKMGLNFRRNDFTDLDPQILTHGEVIPIDLTGALTGGVPTGDSAVGFATDQFIGVQAFVAQPEVPIAFYSAGVYFQDEWRATSNLKLTMAIRADRNSDMVCQTNCFSRTATEPSEVSLSPATPFNQIVTANQHRMLPQIDKVVLQPRFGMAWTPFGHSATVLRGGIGIFSDLYPGTLADSFISNPPFSSTFQTFGGIAPGDATNVFNQGTADNASFLSAFNGGGNLLGILAANPGFSSPGFIGSVNQVKNPKYVEWNMEVQHSFGSSTVLDMDYVGTHGYDLFVFNPSVNAFSATGFGGATEPTVIGGTNFGPNPSLGIVQELTNEGKSNYNGITTRVERRMGYGFQGSINWTYSHSLDSVSNGGVLPYNTSTSILTQINPFNLNSLNYGNSDYDVRHNITANYIWSLPYKFQNTLAEEILGGWELSGTLYAATGRPYSVVDFSPLSNVPSGQLMLGTFTGGSGNSCDRPHFDASGSQIGCFGLNSSGNPLNFAAPGTETSFGNFARNQFRGPAYFDTDFSVLKNFKITERVGLRLGATAYNVLNHPNFALPDGNVADGPSFGTINSTAIQPTSPYGSFQGSAVSGRILQLTGKITF